MAPSSSPSPRTLSSLPSDVLYEILALVLSDTTDRRRVSILRACRALHQAAGVHLYRSVYAKSLTSWKLLFGREGTGLLTEEGGRDLGKYVRELRLGARIADFDERRYTPFEIGTLSLPNCSTVLIEHSLIDVLRPALFRPLFAQLQPTTLAFPSSGYLSFTSDPFLVPPTISSTLPNQIGLPYRAWPSLRVLHFDGVLLRACSPHCETTSNHHHAKAPALSTWEIPTVVFSSRAQDEDELVGTSQQNGGRDLWDFLGGRGAWPGDGAFDGWKRVELRVGEVIESYVRENYKLRDALQAAGGRGRSPTEEERRFFSRIVFVGEDGNERRLVEQSR